ncbi:circadian clock KaiB family protein [Mesorhizobium retamae]|uniref:KaiB domain-containing protein n=1 Tax=Mesorhizobium retamae TaxID=2912854 RepID=A0ABS9QJZ9_9HYPH|nr:circadian clock KaiB family protein [Mesorhizobium sp. IRAMC:0171]MCG7507774.1 hypothetical protein [Mesorhizobium sp. IRAMC:0171]
MTMKLRTDVPPTLRLYIAGDGPAMQAALECREKLLEFSDQKIDIAVIDILATPQAAQSAGVLATPTLSDDTRSPPRRLVGDLSALDRIVEHFDLQGTGTIS